MTDYSIYDLRKITEAYEGMTGAQPQRKLYNPRLGFPKVRGGWTKDKIRRNLQPSTYGLRRAAEFIAEYDSVEDLKAHLFYHGTPLGTSKGMIPSIKKSEKWAAENGGGGYGQRYWGISVTPSKKIASNFSGTSQYIRIYPILLAKGAKVVEEPGMQDAIDVEDTIEKYWDEGVDAIKLGDWEHGPSETELLVLNPRAICNIGEGDFYKVYRLGQEENPLTIPTDDDIRNMYDFAREFAAMKVPHMAYRKGVFSYIRPSDGQVEYRRNGDFKDGQYLSGDVISKEEFDRMNAEYDAKEKEFQASEPYRTYQAAKDKFRSVFRR